MDYALKSEDKWMMFVEAKALDKSINDHKYITQAVNYASNAGVAWALLTNGRQWDLYSTFAPRPAKERLSFSVSIDDDDFLDRMQLLTFEAIEHLDAHLRSQQNRSTVKAAVEQLFQTQDKGLLRLLKSKTDLEAGAIRTALADLQVRFGAGDLGGGETEHVAVKPELEPIIDTPLIVVAEPLTSTMFSCVNQSGVNAKGRLTTEGFVVLAGSVGSATVGKSLAPYLVTERKDLIREGRIVDEGDCVRFLTDVRFKGPSRAASIVLGRGGTGLIYWKIADGRTLADLKAGRSLPKPPAAELTIATNGQPVSVFGLSAPGGGKRPVFIRIEGQEFPVDSWRSLYICACEYVVRRHPGKWKEVLVSEVFMRRKSRVFGVKVGAMRAPIEISTGFVEVHFSGDALIKWLQVLFNFVGIDPAQVEYAMLSKS